MIVGIPAEIRVEHLAGTSLECYRETILLGWGRYKNANNVWVENVSRIHLEENNNCCKNLDLQEINNEELSKIKNMQYAKQKATLTKQ